MSKWPSETCHNCKRESYTLAVRKKCPYCDKDFIIQIMINEKINDAYVIRRKLDDLGITKEELEKIKILKALMD